MAGRGPFKDARSGFSQELERVLNPRRKYAFARFHDGEQALLLGASYRSRSGWTASGPTWLRDPLAQALAFRDPRYVVGISPPCDLPQVHAWYRERTRDLQRGRGLSYATLFMHSNYPVARARFQALLDQGAALVACRGGDVSVPRSVNAAWDVEGIVDRLARIERPILLCCGPAAAVLIHRYCLVVPAERRQMIIDAGAVLDHRIHGRATREYQRDASALRQHVCSFDQWQPWAKKYQNPNAHGRRRERMLAASRAETEKKKRK